MYRVPSKTKTKSKVLSSNANMWLSWIANYKLKNKGVALIVSLCIQLADQQSTVCKSRGSVVLFINLSLPFSEEAVHFKKFSTSPFL